MVPVPLRSHSVSVALQRMWAGELSTTSFTKPGEPQRVGVLGNQSIFDTDTVNLKIAKNYVIDDEV